MDFIIRTNKGSLRMGAENSQERTGCADLGVACFKILRNVQKARPQAFPGWFAAARNSFRAIPALRDISFELGKGEYTKHHRPQWRQQVNLSEIISGTLAPSSQHESRSQRPRGSPAGALGSGFNPEFTGRENVLLNAARSWPAARKKSTKDPIPSPPLPI